MKFPGVVAVLCVVPSGLVLLIGITSCTFPPWAEMSKKKIGMNSSKFGIWQWKGDFIENNLRNVVETEENQVIGQRRLKVNVL